MYTRIRHTAYITSCLPSRAWLMNFFLRSEASFIRCFCKSSVFFACMYVWMDECMYVLYVCMYTLMKEDPSRWCMYVYMYAVYMHVSYYILRF